MKGIEPNKPKISAKNIKSDRIIKIIKGGKMIDVQFFLTYFQASCVEKNSFPFNCFNVTLFTAALARKRDKAQMAIPV